MNSNQPDLIQRIRSSDGGSFDDIVSLYAENLYRLCVLLLQDRDEAKDIVQETLFRFIRSVQEKKFRSANGSIKGYLNRIARNLCLDRIKQRYKFREGDEESIETSFEALDTNTPDRVTDESRLETHFAHALSRLTPLQRTILILHEVNEESYEDIARTLNLTVNNVRTHLWRARETMRRLLAPYWINR